jgi:hypothetical protein
MHRNKSEQQYLDKQEISKTESQAIKQLAIHHISTACHYTIIIVRNIGLRR